MFGKLKFGAKSRKPFAITSLNTFADLDSLYWNYKKYRDVFLKEEVGYLYFDLSEQLQSFIVNSRSFFELIYVANTRHNYSYACVLRLNYLQKI